MGTRTAPGVAGVGRKPLASRSSGQPRGPRETKGAPCGRAGRPSTQTQAWRRRAQPEDDRRGSAQGAQCPSLRRLASQGGHQSRRDSDPRSPEIGGPRLPELTPVPEALPAPQRHPLPAVLPRPPHFLATRLATLPTSPQWSLLSHVLPHSRAVLVTLDRLCLLLDEPLPTSLEPRPPRPDTREAVVGSAWPPVFI